MTKPASFKWVSCVLCAAALLACRGARELQRCSCAASHTVGFVPFPPLALEWFHLQKVLCRSWWPHSLALAVPGPSFRARWCLLNYSWELALCVWLTGNKPHDISLLFVSLRITICPLEAAFCWLVAGVPLGPRWDSLGALMCISPCCTCLCCL